MTRKTRTIKQVKNSSVISGLRLEPELARNLVLVAREDARQRGETHADLARETRLLLRLALMGGATEDPPRGAQMIGLVAGLRVEAELLAAVRAYCAKRKTDFGLAGCVRHLLRIHLGWTAQASLQAERKFAELARQRQAANAAIGKVKK